MSEKKSPHSESRNVGYENISKQMSERSAHSESKKGSKQMSERSAHSVSRKVSKQMSERSAHSESRNVSKPMSQRSAHSESRNVSKPISERSAHSESRNVSKPMSERSAHSVSRKDNDVAYEKMSKQMSSHLESRKDDGVEYDKSCKQMSEDSRSKKDDDVEYEEKGSKRKHDESEAESEHVSSTKEQQSYKTTPKEKEADDHEVSKTSKDAAAAAAEEVSGSKKPTKRSQFVRIFTYKDDKRILKALHKFGYTTGSKPFWDRIGHTLELSIQADQKQLYSKIRRLRRDYLKGYKLEKSSKKERKLYQLSDKIWNKEAKAQPPRKKAKHKQQLLSVHDQEKEEEDNYDVKLEKFVRGLHNEVKFPVAESLEVVHASKRSTLQKKWNDLNGYMFKLYMTKIDLIRETMEAVGSSPLFTSADD